VKKVLKTLRNCLETADTALLFLQDCPVCVCGLFLYVLSFKHTNRQKSDVSLGQWGATKYNQQFHPRQYYVRHPLNYWLYGQLYLLAGKTCRLFPYNLDFNKRCEDLSSLLLLIYCAGKYLGPIILITLVISVISFVDSISSGSPLCTLLYKTSYKPILNATQSVFWCICTTLNVCGFQPSNFVALSSDDCTGIKLLDWLILSLIT
jgi:hypothetical protein